MTLCKAAAGLLTLAVLVAVCVSSTASPAASDRHHGQLHDRDRDRDHRRIQRALAAAVADGVPGVLGRAEIRTGDRLGDPRAWQGTDGVADRRSRAPRLAGERFRIGSVTKTFVATVVLQLAAERRLELDAPVARWLPGVLRGRGHDGRRTTVRQLLNHTSGVYDYTDSPAFRGQLLGPAFLAHRFDTRTPAQLVRMAMAHPPEFPPGGGWRYSNTNYVLAGMLVEAVTGRGYGAEIQRRIIHPLGLRDTSTPGVSPGIPGRHARGYATLSDGPSGAPSGGRPQQPPPRDVTALNPSLAGASGEMISSARDLVVFLRALLDGRLLPDRQLREMTATVPTAAPGTGTDGGAGTVRERYGLGLSARQLSCGRTVWGHDGGIHGSSATVFSTRDGTRAAAFHANGAWGGWGRKLLEAGLC